MPFLAGIRRLGQLVVDVHKNWGGYRIENLGAADTGDDALRQDQAAGSPTRSAPARALNTIYQNATGKPVLVVATVECWMVSDPSPYYSSAVLQIGPASPPDTVVAEVRAYPQNINYLSMIRGVLVGLVPNSWYYRVLRGGAEATYLNYWEEITW